MERSYVRRIAGLGVMLGWLAASAPGQITTNIWDGESSTDWMTAANWTNSTANDVALADGNAVEFYAVGNNLSTILGQDWIIDRLIFNAGADSDVTIGGANTLTISNGIIVDADSAGAHAILANVALAQSQTWTINSSTNFTVVGVVSGDAAANLVKAGVGTLILSGTNTYSGTTTISAGALRVQNDSGLGSTAGGTTVSATGAALELEGGISIGAEALGLTGTGIGTGGALRNISGDNTYGGNITLNAGGVRINSDQDTLTLSGTIARDTGNRAVTFGGDGNITVSGTIGNLGTGAISKDGAGTLTLSSANSYTGNTTINAGTVLALNDSSLGTAGTVTLANTGASLDLGDGVTISRAMTVGNTGNAKVLGLQTGATSAVYAGAITVNETTEGNFQVTATGVGKLEISGVIGSATLAGVQKTGDGTVLLSGTNTYTGATRINAGTLTVTSIAGAGTNSALGTGVSNAVVRMGNNNNTGTLEYIGSGATTDRQIQIGSGTVGNTGGATILNNGTGALVFSATDFNSPFATATGTRALTLGGSNTGANAILGAIIDNVGVTTTGRVNVSKIDAGTWILAGTNTYTGATTIGGGTLIVTGGLAIGDLSAVTLSNVAGALLQLQSDEIIGSLAGGDGIGGTVDLGGNTLTVGGNNSSTIFGGTITNTGALVKQGTGTMALTNDNTYSGPTTVAGGTLVLGSANALPGGVGTTGGTSALGLTGGGVLGLGFSDFTRELGTGVSNVAWTGSGGFAAYGADRRVNIGGATQQLAWGQTDFVSGDDELVFGADDATHTLIFENDIVLSGTNRFRANDGTAAVDGRVEGDLSGTGSFWKTGAGTLELAGSNTYSGATEIFGGQLLLSGANALPDNTHLVISNFAVVVLGAGDFTRDVGTGSGEVEWTGSGGFAAAGADRVVNLFGDGQAVTWGVGNFVPHDETLVLGAVAATHMVDFQNGIVLGDAGTNRTVQVDDGTGAVDAQLSGVLAGGAGFTKTGAGTLALSGANTYTGLTVVSAGALRAQHDDALGTTDGGTIVNSGAALELAGGVTIGTEELTLAGTGIATGGALRNISGSNVFGGTIVMTANTDFGSDAGVLVLDGDVITGDGGVNRNVTFRGAGDIVVNALMNTNTVSGGGVLTKQGTGTLTVVGASGHTGNTVVREGTLKLGGDNVLTRTNATFVANQTGSFAILDVAGTTNQIGGLTIGQTATGVGSSNIIIDSVGGGLLRLGGNVSYAIGSEGFTNAGSTIAANLDLTASRTFTVNDSELAAEDLVISGSITNSGATPANLTKAGAGTLVLSGANTYDGLTIVSAAGTLVAANNQAFGSVGYISMTNTGARLELADGITIDRNMIIENRAENKTLAIRGGASVATYAGDITILETTANNFDIAADAGGTLTISGVIGGGGAAGVEKVGAGTVVFATNNTYTGQTTISVGTLQVGAGGPSGTLGGGAVVNNSALVFNRSDTHTVANAISGSGILTNAGSGTTILTAANSFSGGSVISAGALELRNASAGGTGDIRLDGGNLWLLINGNGNFGNDLYIDQNGTNFIGRIALGGAVTHTVGDINIADGRTFLMLGTNLNNNTSYNLTAADLILANDGTVDIREGPGTGVGTLRVNNVLAGGAGQDLTVRGNNVNRSRLYVGEGLYLGGNLTIGPTALLRTPDGATNVAGNINLNGGVLALNMDFARELGTGAGQVRLTGAGTQQSGFSAFDNPAVVRIEDGFGNLTNLVWGAATFNPGQLLLNTEEANNTLEFQNDIDLGVASGSGNRTITVHNNVATISGDISNSGAGRANLVKGGATGGTLSLTGATDWNGQTRIAAGVLRVTNVTALASSFAASNLFINSANNTAALETQGLLTNALGGGVGQVRIVGGGNAGQNSRPGFSAYGGDLTIDLGGDGTGTGSQLVWGSADFNPSGPSTNNGALFLNTANADGTVRLMNDIDLNGQDLFLSGPDYRRIQVEGSTAVLGGDISNAGSDPVGILKRGAGTLVMAGNNTYDGLTEVAAGTLLVNGSHFGGGDYTVSGGTTLGGTGTIGSAILIASNAVMSPGNSIGTFTTTNNFTFSTGGVLQIELDHVLAASDMLVVSGALDISGAILSLTNLGTGGDLALLDDTYIIAQYGSLIGDTFFNHADVLGLLPTGYEIEYNYLGGNQIALVIPEPGAIAALLLGGVVVGALARRRRATMAAMGETRR